MQLSRFIALTPMIIPGLGVSGRKAVARTTLEAGTVLNEFAQPVFTRPTMHTVCLSASVHVAPTQGAEFISHACADTNTRITVSANGLQGKVVTTRKVFEGEDLSFNYQTTEWILSCPFQCACKSCCLAAGDKVIIRGFAFLPPAERMRLWNEASPYVRAMASRAAAVQEGLGGRAQLTSESVGMMASS
jgi:hypothetical protein